MNGRIPQSFRYANCRDGSSVPSNTYYTLFLVLKLVMLMITKQQLYYAVVSAWLLSMPSTHCSTVACVKPE